MLVSIFMVLHERYCILYCIVHDACAYAYSMEWEFTFEFPYFGPAAG